MWFIILIRRRTVVYFKVKLILFFLNMTLLYMLQITFQTALPSQVGIPSIGELASSPTIGHDLRIVYIQILIG